MDGGSEKRHREDNRYRENMESRADRQKGTWNILESEWIDFLNNEHNLPNVLWYLTVIYQHTRNIQSTLVWYKLIKLRKRKERKGKEGWARILGWKEEGRKDVHQEQRNMKKKDRRMM